jgi:hypothetical protein
VGFSSSDFWVLKISTRFAAYSLSVCVVFYWYLGRFLVKMPHTASQNTLQTVGIWHTNKPPPDKYKHLIINTY